jgi:TetR/AcrR family transcriptional regulator, transcriptional repressor for nem operon
MKVTRAQAEKNRERVVETAGALFREKGFDGIGLNDLMEAAGLTHGAFYGQFKSKGSLAVEATSHALGNNVAAWRDAAAKGGDRPLAALIRFYLSTRHRDHPGEGCTLAALGTDAARHGSALRASLQTGIEAYLDMLDEIMPKSVEDDVRDTSIATLATMVGALIMSRAVNDKVLSRRILDVASERLCESVAE